jgi:hypothetical protein
VIVLRHVGVPTHAAQQIDRVHLMLETINATTMSLCAEKYQRVSNRPSTDFKFSVSAVTIDSGFSTSCTVGIARCRNAPCVPVTYHPPHRCSKGVR